MKRLFGMLVVALLALAIPTTVGAAPGGVGIGLIGTPAQAYIEHTASPGELITRQVRVHNHAAIARDITLVVGPAGMDAHGSFTEAPTNAINPLVTWTEVDRPVVRLDGGQSTDITVTIAVPADAPDTSQYAIVWAEAGSTRAGLRLYIDVDGDNGPAVAPAIDDITGARLADDTASVRAAVTNQAGYPVRIGGTLDLTGGPAGAQILGVAAPQTALAPGQSAELTFVVPGGATVADGPWQATVRVDDGYTRADHSGEVTFPRPSDGTGGGTGSLGSLDLFGSLG